MPYTDKTIGAFLEAQAERLSDHEFIVYPDRDLRFTFSQSLLHIQEHNFFCQILMCNHICTGCAHISGANDCYLIHSSI